MKEIVAAGAAVAGIVLLVVWIVGPTEKAPSAPAERPKVQTTAPSESAQPSPIQRAEAIAAQQEAAMAAQFPTLDDDARTALQSVRDQLLDADSARFRNVWAMRYRVQGQPDTAIFCGEVNGRNRFGGYVGFEPFMALGHTAYTAETSGVFDSMYRDFCEAATPIREIDPDDL